MSDSDWAMPGQSSPGALPIVGAAAFQRVGAAPVRAAPLSDSERVTRSGAGRIAKPAVVRDEIRAPAGVPGPHPKAGWGAGPGT